MPVYPALIVGSLLLGGLIVPSFLTPVSAAPSGQQTAQPAPTPEQAAFFEQNIRPTLATHCYDCHSAETRAAGQLRLDDRDALLTGGKSGPAIIPGDPDHSILIHRVLADDPTKQRMPKGEDEPLSAKEIADLKTWIAQGAPWPAGADAPRFGFVEMKRCPNGERPARSHAGRSFGLGGLSTFSEPASREKLR